MSATGDTGRRTLRDIAAALSRAAARGLGGAAARRLSPRGLGRAVRGLASCETSVPSDEAVAARRIAHLLGVNAVALWASTAVLVVLRLTLTSSHTLTVSALCLAGGALLLTIGRAFVRRSHAWPAAMLMIVANWLPAVGVAYVSPFITPVALFAVVVPLVLLVDFLPPRQVVAVTALTIVTTGAIAGLGEWRREQGSALQPEAFISVPLLVLFVVAVVSVVAIGLWLHTSRLTEQARELALSRSRLASAADDARRAIERDLHDGAQQRLSALSVRLGLAARLVADDPDQARDALATAHAELHDAIRELRDLAHGIYPALLEQRGLGPALAAAARRSGRRCHVEATGAGRYAAPIENAVYFCCLEAMHNADRHSGADIIRVQVGDVDVDGVLAFTVSDDGAGFDPQRVPTRGLTGMVDRVRAAGGTLAIDSAPGAGTRVTGRIPLHHRH